MSARTRQSRPAARPLAVVLALTTLALGACGGAGDTASTRSTGSADAIATAHAPGTHGSTRPASTVPGGAAFIARADAICRRLNGRLTATAPRQGEGAAAIARNAMQHAILERRTTAELRRLVPPTPLARDWTRILAYRSVLAGDLITLSHMLSSGRDPQTSGLLAAKSAAHAAMSAIAAHDHFDDCVKVGSAS